MIDATHAFCKYCQKPRNPKKRGISNNRLRGNYENVKTLGSLFMTKP